MKPTVGPLPPSAPPLSRQVVKTPGNPQPPAAAAAANAAAANKTKGDRIKSPLRGRPEPPSGESRDRDMKRPGGGSRGDGHRDSYSHRDRDIHHRGGGGGKDAGARLPNGRIGGGPPREKGAWA